jgi:hypothetical protein
MACREFDVPAEDVTRRKDRVRGRTVSVKRLAKRDLYADARLYPASINEAHPRPRTRAECIRTGLGTPGNPCPHVSCKHHLAIEVHPENGGIRQNFPDREVWQIPETCALVVADRGGMDGAAVGQVTNLTRERVRQIEARALAKLLAALPPGVTLDDLAPRDVAPHWSDILAPKVGEFIGVSLWGRYRGIGRPCLECGARATGRKGRALRCNPCRARIRARRAAKDGAQ